MGDEDIAQNYNIVFLDSDLCRMRESPVMSDYVMLECNSQLLANEYHTLVGLRWQKLDW